MLKYFLTMALYFRFNRWSRREFFKTHVRDSKVKRKCYSKVWLLLRIISKETYLWNEIGSSSGWIPLVSWCWIKEWCLGCQTRRGNCTSKIKKLRIMILLEIESVGRRSWQKLSWQRLRTVTLFINTSNILKTENLMQIMLS